jgi:hypothetical protein
LASILDGGLQYRPGVAASMRACGWLLGALSLSELVAAVPFPQIALPSNHWIPGILILVGVGIFSRARGGRSALLGTGEA